MVKGALTVRQGGLQRGKNVIQRFVCALKKGSRWGEHCFRNMFGRIASPPQLQSQPRPRRAETIVAGRNGSLRLVRKHFSAGSFREAHECSVEHGSVAGFSEGTKLVLKSMKRAKYNEDYRIESEDFDMQKKVSELAQKFNDEVQPKKDGRSCNIHVVRSEPFVMPEAKYLNGKLIVNKGETVALEPYIDGKYEKFNSNDRWACDNAELPGAFSHWTWVHTDGECLVCDLQGHRGHPGGPKYNKEEYYYLLTDPAIISREEGAYGMTDMGIQGMRIWFEAHKCTSMCKSLGLTSKLPSK